MFKGTLYKPQIPAAAFLCNRKRVLLAWEQGTGKTIISVAAAEKLFSLKKAKNVLIVAQSSNAFQWEDKINEFTDTKVTLVTAANKESRKYLVGGGKPSYTVTSWALFRKDFQTIAKKKWDIVILDEAQEIKNNHTKAAQLAKLLNVKVKPTYRWALTGTAISTKLEELYGIMYWVDPKFLPPWNVFVKNHCIYNDFKLISGYKNLKELNIYLQHRMDRKTQADMEGHLPKLMPPVVHTIDMNTQLKNAHKVLIGHLDELVGNIFFDDDGTPQLKHSPEVAKAYAEVQAQLAGPEKLALARVKARHILDENPTNRIIMFSHRKDPLYELQGLFGDSAVLFTGDQTLKEKRSNFDEFLVSDYVRILLASNAGASGLDARTANHVFNLDVPPSFGILDQRIKRVTRLSSIHPFALSHYFIYLYSVEHFLYYLVNSRGALASGALEGTVDEVIVRPQSLRSFLKSEDQDIPSLG